MKGLKQFFYLGKITVSSMEDNLGEENMPELCSRGSHLVFKSGQDKQSLCKQATSAHRRSLSLLNIPLVEKACSLRL